MVLTVRQRGQLLLLGGKPMDDVVAAIWFDEDEEGESWGGTLEPALAASLLRAQVRAGETRYRLRLEDGREGNVMLALSEFEADGETPLTFAGAGVLTRRGPSGR